MTLRYFEAAPRRNFMTTDEVLDYLKVNPRTIYRLIHRGDLPAVRVGRQWRFRQSDVDAWLDRQRLPAL
jgi:excisionase family DNA binding protein